MSASDGRVISWDPLADDDLGLSVGVLAIGIFDGLHIGHRALLEEARAHAADTKAGSWAVLTFESDPDEFFHPDAPTRRLMSDADRLALLAGYCPDRIVTLPTRADVLGLAPEDFLERLGVAVRPERFVVGADFRFGAGNAGTVVDIARWGRRHGCACEGLELLESDGAPVTSTRIRRLLQDGDIEAANALLYGGRYCVTGRVGHGRGEGGRLGFATANVELPEGAPMLPKDGVYAGVASADGEGYAAAINVGRPPSFADATCPLEAHLLDCSEDLYGQEITVGFLQRLRDSRRFDSEAELAEAVQGDIARVRETVSAPVPAYEGGGR
ncbi:MAG: riboflavin biosynthesis protein RibF [Coriobacteriaceae bacterium]|nr:riboflavin biosynthesis protein RibF [Coriobacteriaceae bacterium]